VGWFNFLWSFFVCSITYFRSYRPIILPIVLCGCETWPYIEEYQGMRVFKNDVEDVCTYKREGNRDWRKLHEAFHNLYSLLNIMLVVKSRRMRRMGHVTHL